ncbi:MAG: chromate transporter [Firmicutes bacterium]|nr:chromate transporter [Bacillota bacterium]
MKTWLQLFWGFFKVGILGYGGGPGSISLIQVVTVDGNHWMSNQQFAEMLAVGNALPGPIATKLAASIGYQVGGPVGAVAALAGVVLPSLVLMLGLYRILLVYKANPYVAGLIRGVKPIVIVLLLLLIIELIPTSFPKDRWAIPAVFFAAGFVAMYWLKVPAVWVILASMAGGAWFLR